MMRSLAVFLLLCLVALMPPAARAQTLSLPGVTSAAPAPAAPAAQDLLDQAARSGLSVIVIDPSGKVTVQPATTPAGPAAVPMTDDAAEKAAQEAAMPLNSPLMMVQSRATEFRATLQQRLDALPGSIEQMLFILRAQSPDGRIQTFVEALIYSLLLFAVGSVVERQIYGKRIARHIIVPMIKPNPVGYSDKMPFLIVRFFGGVIGALISAGVAYAIGFAIFGETDSTPLRLTITVIYTAYLSARFVSGLWRMILSPYLPQYRIPVLSDRDAKRLHNWLWILGSIDICTILFSIWLSELGLTYDVYALVASISSLVVSVLNVLMVLVNHRAISRAIRNGMAAEEVTVALRFLSRAWAPLVIVYVGFAWLEMTYRLVIEQPTSVPMIIGGYGILLAILVVYGLISLVIERAFANRRTISLPPVDADPAAPAPRAAPKIKTVEQLARRAAGFLALLAGIAACIRLWGANMNLLADNDTLGLLRDIAVTVFIGYFIHEFFRIWIDSKIEEEVGDAPQNELGDEGGAASSATRIATLLPLFRNIILFAVLATTVLILLTKFGVNVNALFAGAGVVGLAIGFGAQSLVRDVFSGAFFLIDDAFRKGEYIDIGTVKGTVERISIRSFQLRHHLGPIHTIPFGEIQFLTNFSRDWVIMKLPLRVTYDTDVEKVRKLVKNLGLQLLEDPEIGHNFLQPLRSQGVIEMQDSAMIIRVKFMTKPGDQWNVRKRVYQEVQDLFRREGIKFAHREVTVRLADGLRVDDLSDEQKRAVSGAAQAAILADEMEAAMAAGKAAQ